MKAYIGRYPKGDKERKISIRIDPWDVWNMDHTLALIIVPMLKKLKEDKQGVPHVSDEDVPEELRSNKQIVTEYHEILEKKWNYVLDSMIWSFEETLADYPMDAYYDVPGEIDKDQTFIKNEDGTSSLNWKVESKFNKDKFEAHEKKLAYGYTMFGKYFRAMWT